MTDEKSPGDAPKQSDAPKKDSPVPASSYAPVTQAVKLPTAEQQWHLALAHLGVGDRASNMLRALLFVTAIALFALILSTLRPGLKGPPIWAHGASLVFCAVAIGAVVKGLRLQSEQSYERFRLLKDGNLEALAQHDSVVEQLRGRQSGTWTRVAIWSLAAAILIELIVRFLPVAAGVHV